MRVTPHCEMNRSSIVIQLNSIEDLYPRRCLCEVCLKQIQANFSDPKGILIPAMLKITMQVGYLERAHAKRQLYNRPGRDSIGPAQPNTERGVLTVGRDQ